jgi:hypothetical protein
MVRRKKQSTSSSHALLHYGCYLRRRLEHNFCMLDSKTSELINFAPCTEASWLSY